MTVMSIETYEQLVGRFELYGLIQEGMEDVRNGNMHSFSEVLSDLRGGKSNDFPASNIRVCEIISVN